VPLRHSDSRREDRRVTIRFNPYARAQSIAEQVMEILMGTAGDAEAEQRAMQHVPRYRSRGKGQGLPTNKHSMRCVAHDKREALKARNRLRAKGRR
jgi:hypothetical protein